MVLFLIFKVEFNTTLLLQYFSFLPPKFFEVPKFNLRFPHLVRFIITNVVKVSSLPISAYIILSMCSFASF